MPVLYIFYVCPMSVVGSHKNISRKQKHLGFKQDKKWDVLPSARETKEMQRLWEYLVLLSSAFVLNKNRELK